MIYHIMLNGETKQAVCFQKTVYVFYRLHTQSRVVVGKT